MWPCTSGRTVRQFPHRPLLPEAVVCAVARPERNSNCGPVFPTRQASAPWRTGPALTSAWAATQGKAASACPPAHGVSSPTRSRRSRSSPPTGPSGLHPRRRTQTSSGRRLGPGRRSASSRRSRRRRTPRSTRSRLHTRLRTTVRRRRARACRRGRRSRTTPSTSSTPPSVCRSTSTLVPAPRVSCSLFLVFTVSVHIPSGT